MKHNSGECLANLGDVRDAILPWGQVVHVASDEGNVLCLPTLNHWECYEDRENVGISELELSIGGC